MIKLQNINMAFGERTGDGGLSSEYDWFMIRTVPIPSEVDEAWCGMITEAYGGGETYRVAVPTLSYLCSSNPRPGRGRNYDAYSCSPPDGGTAKIEGLLMGAEMIPQFDDRGTRLAHVRLIDAEMQTPPFRIEGGHEAEVLVPLTNAGAILTLYPEGMNI